MVSLGQFHAASIPPGVSQRHGTATEQVLLHLAHRVARQRVDHADLARALVHRQRRRHVVDRARRCVDLVAHHEGDDALAEVVVGHPHHRHLAHRRVVEQRRLHLAGADLEAARLDDVHRLAADDAMEAVGVDHRGVAGAEPLAVDTTAAVASGRCEVAVEQGGDRAPAARRSSRRRARTGLAVVADQAGAHAVDRHAHPARPALAVGASAQRDERLGHAVALDRRVAGERRSCSNTGTGSGALPDTSSRALAQRRGRGRVGAHSAPHRGHAEVERAAGRRVRVGRRADRCAPAAHPTRSAPSTPSTRPCTWNSGRPCTSVSSGVHCHASASPSRPAAMARRDSTTPFGAPVVPDVYIDQRRRVVGGSGSGSAADVDASARRVGQWRTAATAPESRRMCSRSTGPASGGTGTTGTPAASPATTATTVCSVGVASTATARHARQPRPRAVAALGERRPSEMVSPATVTAVGAIAERTVAARGAASRRRLRTWLASTTRGETVEELGEHLVQPLAVAGGEQVHHQPGERGLRQRGLERPPVVRQALGSSRCSTSWRHTPIWSARTSPARPVTLVSSAAAS